MNRPIFVFHSALAPRELVDTLQRTTDQEQWTIFSLSGYRGGHPILSVVGVGTFRLRKRIKYRNDLARLFYGRFNPESGATRIEGYFDVPGWSRIFMRIRLAFAVVIGTLIFVSTLIDLLTGTHHVSGDTWIGLVLPPALVLFGMVLPIFGRLIGQRDERFILEYIQNTLAARIEPAS
jgi:hypothetical protein